MAYNKKNKISKQSKNNAFIIFSLVIFWGLILLFISKLWYYQIDSEGEITIVQNRGEANEKAVRLKGTEEKRTYLKNSSERKLKEIGRRGRILDRNGKEIATSVPNDDKKSQSQWKREYSYKKSAPLIGYVKKDFSQEGQYGIEKAFDSHLSGKIGFSELRRDGRGKTIPKLGKMQQNVKDGDDLYLTIDLEIQKIVDNVLEETAQNSEAKGGMAIIMNPHNGEIYAMSSYPSFDPIVRKSIEKNKAIAENYEPGSIFKTITFASAINEGLITPDELVDCQNGTYEIPKERPIKDDHPLGIVPYSDAYKYSSNIASLKIVKEKLGNKLFYEYCQKFGIGAKTGLGFQEEEKGIFNPLETWQPRDALSMGFGNSVSVTLIQMAVMTSAIANGGIIMKPQIYKKITDKNGKTIQQSEKSAVRQVISEETAKTMRNLMSNVVNEHGTGQAAGVEGLNIGGKTGTSKKVEKGKYLEGKYWASFTGITPIDKPVFVVCVSVDEPKGKYGGPVAGKAVATILEQILASPKIHIGKEINLYKDTVENIEADEISENKLYPNFIGFDLQKARKISKELKIEYEISGGGNTIIDQNPKAGSEIKDYAIITLYTDSIESEISMPNVVGKDINLAINMLNARGINPEYLEVGTGKVRKQHPTVGTIWKENMQCSLFVEKGIFGK